MLVWIIRSIIVFSYGMKFVGCLIGGCMNNVKSVDLHTLLMYKSFRNVYIAKETIPKFVEKFSYYLFNMQRGRRLDLKIPNTFTKPMH